MKEDSGTSTLSSDVTGTGTVYIRINIPEISIQKCLQFQLNETVWQAKQRVLATFAKDLRDGLNYGFYCPPINGRAGKFLDEERLLREYPLKGPIGFLEFKYKRRVYKLLQIKQGKIKQLHTKASLKEFLQYVKHAYTERILRATQKGLDSNFHDEKTGETPLTLATTLDSEICRPIIMALANGGAHLDFRNIYGLTPMHKAAIRGNSVAIKTLLDLGASPNYKDGRGLTPLYYSVGHDSEINGTEMLLHERALVGTPDEQGWFELHHACRHGRVQHLELLVFYGADMNVQNASGNTPLHVCAVNNQESCARVLLFRGARKDTVNFANQMAQQVAIISGNNDLASIIQNFTESEIVPFRELPTYSNRRQFGTMTASMRNIMRSRSDPRINILTWGKEQPSTTLNDSTSDGSCIGYHSDSPRHSISSSNSSGPVAGFPMYDANQNDQLQMSMDISGRTTKAKINGYTPRRVNSAGDLSERFNQATQLVDIPQFENHVRTVELQKGREGYGFVLRGAKSQNSSSASLEFEPSPEYPALQYLDSVDKNSMAEKCGLRGGDFILEINNHDVVRATHEHVVSIIKNSGNLLRLKVVTVTPMKQKAASNTAPTAMTQNAQNVSLTMPTRVQKVRAPMPPKRDPCTQLSYSKGRSKSFAEGIAEIEKLDQTLAIYDSDARSFSSSMEGLNKLSLSPNVDVKVASIRSSTAAKRVSCIQLDDEYSISTFDNQNQTPVNQIPISKKCSPSEMRIQKYHKKQSPNFLEKSSSSPNIAARSKDVTYATPTVINGYGSVSSPGYRTLVSIHPDNESLSSASEEISSSSSNQYSATSLGVNSALDTKLLASALSTNREFIAMKGKTKRQPPPPPPLQGHMNIPPPPRQPAPQPPAKSEVIPINTVQIMYANVSQDIQKTKNQSAYESSFRPGTNAQMTSTPKGKNSPNKTATVSPATGKENKAKFSSCPRGGFKSLEAPLSFDTDAMQSEKLSVSFAEDKVLENAASFIERHPNATLLMTKGDQTRHNNEPIPDYDVDSDSSDVPASAAEMHRQLSDSVQSNAEKSGLDINSNKMDVPHSVDGHKVHTKAVVHSPISAPKQSTTRVKKSSVNQSVAETRVGPTPFSPSQSASTPAEAERPPSFTPPPPLIMQTNTVPLSEQSCDPTNVPSVPMPPPPPPLTTTTVLTSTQPVRAQHSVKKLSPAPINKPAATEIAQAVEARRLRIEKASLEPEKKIIIPDPQSALMAAVAKRRTMLENKPSDSVVMDIESKLNRTKKLQAAKFVYPSNKAETDESRSASTLPVTSTSKTVVSSTKSLKKEIDVTNFKVKTSLATCTTAYPATQSKTLPTTNQNINTSTQSSSIIVSSVAKNPTVSGIKISKVVDKFNASNDASTIKANAANKHDMAKSSEVKSSVSNNVQAINKVNDVKKSNATSVKMVNVANRNNVHKTSDGKSEGIRINSEMHQGDEGKRNLNVHINAKNLNDSGETKDMKNVLDSSDRESKVRVGSAANTTNSTDFLALAEKARRDWLNKKGSPTVDNKMNNNLLLVNGKTKVGSIESSSLEGSLFLRNDNSVDKSTTNKISECTTLNGVTIDTSSSDNSLDNSSSDLPPASNANESSSIVQIDVIPPPMNFAEPPGDVMNISAFSHDDTGSIHSSLSTLSTLSSEQGDFRHNLNDFIVPPPPPLAFGDITETPEDNEYTIPPPPQFQSQKIAENAPSFASKNVKDWTCADVLDWLEKLGVAQYKHSFLQQMIDGKRLVGLNRQDYIKLGITEVGHRMNIERSVKKLALKKL